MPSGSLIDDATPVPAPDDPSPAEPALAVIDDALLAFVGRTLVSGDEVVDRLLDLRSAFVAATLLRELEADAFPTG